MSQYISDIVDEDTVSCQVCNSEFNTDEITNEDCCKSCCEFLAENAGFIFAISLIGDKTQ